MPQQIADPLYAESMHRAAFVPRQACREQHCGYDPAAELAAVIARYGAALRIFDILVTLSFIDPRLASSSMGFLSRLHWAARGDSAPLEDLINRFYDGPLVSASSCSAALHAATLGDHVLMPVAAAVAGMHAGHRAARRPRRGESRGEIAG